MSSWFVQTAAETDRGDEPRVGAMTFEEGDEIAVIVFGSHSTGASTLSMRSVLRDLFEQLPALPISPDEWEGALRMADRRLMADENVGQLSAVGVTLTDEAVVGASVGDCHAWLLGDASWELTRMQHARPLLGTSEARPIGFGPSAIEMALLLGTSSLFEQVDAQRAVSLVDDGTTVATQALVSACRSADLGRLASDVALAIVRRKH